MGLNEKTRGLHSLPTFPAIYSWVQKLAITHEGRKWLYDEYIGCSVDDLVLDIGCGPAGDRRFLKTGNYIGIDFNPAYIERAKSDYTDGTFLLGDATTFDFGQFGKFDKILMIGVIHHLPDEHVAPVLKAASALLKPGGVFVARDPAFEPNQNPIARMLALLDRGNHVRDEPAYDKLLAQAFGRREHLIKRNLQRVPYTTHLMKGFNSRQERIGEP